MIEIPQIDLTVIAPMLTVFAWASVLLLVDLLVIPRDRKRVTGYLALGGLGVAALIALPLWGKEATTFTSAPGAPGMVVLDNYALTLTWLFLLIGAIAIAISLDYLPRQGIEQGEFYPLILFAVGGMILMAQGTDLIVLFLAIELLSITLYVLTGFAYPRLSSEEAAMKYLLLGAFAAGFFVYGIALIFGATGSVNLFEIGLFMSELEEGVMPLLVLVGAGLVLVAFGFKIALVPFHMWTPDVYEGSPTPVAAFMSVGTKGAALAALLRILEIAIPTLSDGWTPILWMMAALTMIWGNVAALVQNNVKRMLAYSSIGHAGYILLGIMSVSERGTQGFLYYLLAYALTNLGAFAVVIALEQRGESAWSINDFNGLWKRQGMLAIAMAVFMVSLAGVPPTAGFVGKFYVFTAAWESGLGWLVLIAVITSAIAAFFYLRIVVRMFMHEPVREVQPLLYRGLSIGIGVSAVGVMLFGLIPTPIVALARQSIIATLGG